jgi:hypothetical protein
VIKKGLGVYRQKEPDHQLLFTTFSRLFFVDLESLKIKANVDFKDSTNVSISIIDKITFKVTSKKRSYIFIDDCNGSNYWVNTVNSISSNSNS